MIPIVILRKILLFFAPLILFYFLRRIGKKNRSSHKPHRSFVDKSKIVEGEVVEEDK